MTVGLNERWVHLQKGGSIYYTVNPGFSIFTHLCFWEFLWSDQIPALFLGIIPGGRSM